MIPRITKTGDRVRDTYEDDIEEEERWEEWQERKKKKIEQMIWG